MLYDQNVFKDVMVKCAMEVSKGYEVEPFSIIMSIQNLIRSHPALNDSIIDLQWDSVRSMSLYFALTLSQDGTAKMRKSRNRVASSPHFKRIVTEI